MSETLGDLDHYQVLEVDREASLEVIRRAYFGLKRTFEPGGLATYSLLGPAGSDALAERLDEAWAVLSDPARRQAYDRAVARKGGYQAPRLRLLGDDPESEPPTTAAELPSEPDREIEPLGADPEMPDLDAETDFDGALIRRVREACGLTLVDIVERTRVSRRYLEAIEGGEWQELPQRVFTRGFVMAYARELMLDPEQVWAGISRRYEAARL